MVAQPHQVSEPEVFKLAIHGADQDVPGRLTASGKGCGGTVAFVFLPREGSGLLLHVVPNQPTRLWRTAEGQAPHRSPSIEIPGEAALGELQKLTGARTPASPASLRGQWTGRLLCTNGTPSVVLERKLAAYGVLRITSTSKGRWVAKFDRLERWFSKAAETSAERGTLGEAIQAGLELVVGGVGEACAFRDTHRRNAVDPVHAAQHPYTPPKEPKDPTARLKVPDPAKPAKPRGRKPVAELVPALKDIPSPPVPSCPSSTAMIAAATVQEADALSTLAGTLWGSADAPDMLSRAGKLLARADALIRSPLCQGKEKAAAQEDLVRAAGYYETARNSILSGGEAVQQLRRIAERVGLAAARAGKACAAGQQKLGAPARSAESVGEAIAAREASAPAPRPAVPTRSRPAPPAPARAEAPSRTRTRSSKAADPEKDRALIAAFGSAAKQLAAELRGAVGG